MAKPSFLSPGSVVRVTNFAETGITGYVRRTKPDNGDQYLIKVLTDPQSLYLGVPDVSLSYNASSLAPVE